MKALPILAAVLAGVLAAVSGYTFIYAKGFSAVWGKNFPQQNDGYKRTVDQVRTRYGGSEAIPRTPTQADPRSVVAQSRLE